MPEHSHFRVLSNLLLKNDPRYKRWRKSLKKRPGPWNKGKTRFSDKSVKKISDTFKKKKLDNFARWRENARKSGLIPDPNFPLNKDAELAFLIGLILGDGNVRKSSRTQCLKITLGTDKPLLWKYTAKVVERIFNKKPYIRKRPNINCVDIRIYQNNLSKRLSIPLGARGKLRIVFPKWIYRNREFLLAILKGLYEAEASFSVHKPTYTYNFSFSNTNTSLLDEVERLLRMMGFSPERRVNAVRLRKKQEAYNFKKIINFRSYP